MAYDRNAYGMLSAAVTQTQQRIAQLQAGLKANPAGAAMYKAAIAQEQARLTSYQQGVAQQTASVPVDNAGYQQQKSDIGQQYGAQLAAADYGRTIAQQRHSRQAGDFNVASARQRNTFDSPYLQRGMFRSGVRRRGLEEMRQTQTSAYGNMVGQQAEELGGLAQQRTQLMANRTSALSAVDRARQKAIFDYLGRGS
jgi:hypothetical protein